MYETDNETIKRLFFEQIKSITRPKQVLNLNYPGVN